MARSLQHALGGGSCVGRQISGAGGGARAARAAELAADAGDLHSLLASLARTSVGVLVVVLSWWWWWWWWGRGRSNVVLGNAALLGDGVVHGGVTSGTDKVHGKNQITQDGFLMEGPGATTISTVQEPGRGGKGVELTTCSPHVGVGNKADLHQRVAMGGVSRGPVGAVPGRATVLSAVDASTSFGAAAGLTNSAAMVRVVGAAGDFVEVEGAILSKDSLPGLTSIGGLGDLSGVTVGLGLGGRSVGAREAAISVLELRFDGASVVDTLGVGQLGETRWWGWGRGLGELTGSAVPDVVGGVVGIASKGEQVGVVVLQSFASVVRDGNTLGGTKLTSNTEDVTFTILADIASRLGCTAANGVSEVLSEIVGVELSKNTGNDYILFRCSSGEKNVHRTQLGRASVPCLSAIKGLENLRTLTVGITSSKPGVFIDKGNTCIDGNKVLGDDCPLGSSQSSKAHQQHASGPHEKEKKTKANTEISEKLKSNIQNSTNVEK
eukprot:m.263348 g.263348  ORF g.263348 m.263348 type:complete len:495 (-) comp26885_c0_seq1:1-1485(-)